MGEKEKNKVVNQQDLIHRAKDAFRHCKEAVEETYALQQEDLEFLNGDQWPDHIRADRDQDNRPCLRINKLPQFVDKVQGDLRQSRPSIKISPVDDNSDPETADVLNGIFKNIEMQSDAEVVYDSAGEAMIQCGFGAWRIVTEYIDEDSFDQQIMIRPILNQFSVFLDPSSKDWSGCDGRFAFIIEDVPRKTFERLYPKSRLSPWDSNSDDMDWMTEETVRIAEFFEREYQKETLYLAKGQDGKTKSFKGEDSVPDGWEIVKSRTTVVEKIYWYKITCNDILEGPILIPGKLIPIIPCYGKQISIKGKKHYWGVVRHAKDSQRLYNYFRSMDAETIALAPKAPWVMTTGMLGPHKNSWRDSNRRNFPYLLYEPDPRVPNAKPERTFPQLANQAILNNIATADQELHDTTGLQLASLGKKSNEKSGAAIEARAKAGDIGQFAYASNLMRSIKQTARVILGQIPIVYDTARIERIIGEDKSIKTVTVNEPFQDEKSGEYKVFDLTVGRYDVSASIGPSYETQRQEAQASMIDFIRILPPELQVVISDQIAEFSDWHNKTKIAERLRKMLPPGIEEQESKDEPPQPPTEAEMKAQAMQEAVMENEMKLKEIEVLQKKAELKKTQAEAAEAEASAALKEAQAIRVANGYETGEESNNDSKAGKRKKQ